jgi:hypothetical protein
MPASPKTTATTATDAVDRIDAILNDETETGTPEVEGVDATGTACMTPAQAQKRLAKTVKDARIAYSEEVTAAKVKRDRAVAAAYAEFATATAPAAAE